MKRVAPSTGMWVLEWSTKQCCIHVQTLDDALHAARVRFAENRSPANDYEILFIGSRDEVEAQANHIRPIMTAREKSRVRRAGNGLSDPYSGAHTDAEVDARD